MAEEDFTNRELTLMFDHIREALDRIEKQTIKTNGRVSLLEKWRAYVTGAVALALLLGISNIVKLFTLV